MLQPSVVASAIGPPGGGGGTTTYDVFGYVYGQGTADPVVSAMVKIYVDNVWKGTDYTDANGYFSKSVLGPSIAENFKVLVIKSGWEEKTKYAVPDSQDNVNFGNVYMTRKYTISGEIRDGDVQETVVPDADITLYRDVYGGWSEIGQTTSDSEGKFSFDYTTGDSMTQCKAHVVADGFSFDGLKIVSVSSSTVDMGVVTVSHFSEFITTTVELDVQETQAILTWEIDWGWAGRGINEYIEIKYKGIDAPSWEIDTGQISIPSGVSEGSYTLTGLVMDTDYAWSCLISHTLVWPILWEHTSPNDGTFRTDTWTCSSKYAILINMNTDETDSEKPAHDNSLALMLDKIDDGDSQEWAFTHIEYSMQNTSTKQNFLDAICHYNGVTNSESLLFIYLVGHGSYDNVTMNGIDVTASEIATSLDSYNGDNTPGKMVVFIEACQSGSLINDLQNENRVIIASSDSSSAALNSHFEGVKYAAFTYFLASKLFTKGKSIFNAFNETVTVLEAFYTTDHPGLEFQNPWLADLHPYGTTSYYLQYYYDLGKRIDYNGPLAYKLRLTLQCN
ncbi:MAG: C13 family peptidase [Candidatus Thorarchaeota archaeon]